MASYMSLKLVFEEKNLYNHNFYLETALDNRARLDAPKFKIEASFQEKIQFLSHPWGGAELQAVNNI